MSRITKTSAGEIEIVSLTDGATEFGNELFPSATPEEIATLLKKDGKSAIETNFNAFLVKTGDQTLLVDAGPRDLFGDTCGFLHEALAEAETAPEDVTHLFLTHLHPDHIVGTITPEGQAVFPNAQVSVSEADHAFWSDASQFTDETLSQWQQLAAVVLAAYGDRLELISGEVGIISGVTAIPLPGHTPGHFGFRVDDGSDSFAHVGDIVHAQSLQLANPEIAVLFDVDPDTARATRKRTLDMVATDRLNFSGGHILRPSMGVLERDGAGYRIIPD